MKKLKIPKKLLEKRIPTLLGITVLVISLISGTFFIGKGAGVFSPRASAETTPKKIKITNIYDTSFTVSFLTDVKTAGFIKYGTKTDSLKSQSGDDRDQISGTVGSFKIHHITVRGLKQNTTYYYKIGTGSGNQFDDSGQPFKIKTASRNGAPAAAKTIYGSVTNETGAPAEGAVVYVNVNGAGPMSSQVKASGSWAIPLSNARTKDGSSYALINDEDDLIINVQGSLESQTASLTTKVADSQPVAGIVFGKNNNPSRTTATKNLTEASAKSLVSPSPSISPSPSTTIQNNSENILLENDASNDSASNSADALDLAGALDSTSEATNSASSSGSLSNRTNTINELLGENNTSTQSAVKVVDLKIKDPQTVNTTTPKIVGEAPAGVTVAIAIHSTTEINQSVVADQNGEFSLDIAELSKTLEPGPHTITYSYTDPSTGQLVEKTVNFTVSGTTQLALNPSPSPTPYGSGNPYPIDASSSSSTVASESANASSSAEATPEARTAKIATGEGLPVSGSVGTTMALIFGGLFFIISGLWSFWISDQLEKGELRVS